MQNQTLTIRPATRQGVRPIIDLYGESGCGKTYSALLLARGFVGPKGKMVMIDTEEGRGELYADVAEIAPYEVLRLGEPFSPERYIQAIDAVEKSGASIGILDSGSHEWEGLGGVLDMAETSREKSGSAGLHNWRKPKMEHALFLQKLLRSSIPWIICLRAKFKTRQVKQEGKKAEIVKDDFPTPIQADDFIFEATVHGLIDPDHNFLPRKISHPALADCLPDNAPITIEHGRLLAEWCAMGGKSAQPDSKALLEELRSITESIHGWRKGVNSPAQWAQAKDKLEGWLVAKEIIGADAEIGSLTLDRLVEVIAETKHALGRQQ
jgi:hypothetical protein